MDLMKTLEKIIFGIILFFLAVFALYNIVGMLRILLWPYQIDYGEGFILSITFQYFYKSLNSYPYIITYYTPLFYILIDSFRSLVYLSPSYLYIRSLNLFATACDALMLYIITKKFSGEKFTAALAPLIFLSSALILRRALIFEPIMFELLFDLIALYFLIEYNDRRIVYSALALVLAFLFKQSALVVFVSLALYFLVNKKYKELTLFSAVFLIVLIPIILLINFVTNGVFVFSTFTIPLITPIYPASFLLSLYSFLISTQTSAFLLIAAYWVWYNKKSVIGVSLLVCFASTLSAAKFGATSVYFIVPFALFCIASSFGIKEIFLNRVNKRLGPNRRKLIIYYTLFAFILYFVVLNVLLNLRYPNYYLVGSNETQIGGMLRNVNGTILAESPGVAIAANKSVLFEPSIFWDLQERGIWNDSQIVSDIKTRRFAVITYPTSSNRFGYYPEILNATQTYYRLSYTAYGWYVYVPSNTHG